MIFGAGFWADVNPAAAVIGALAAVSFAAVVGFILSPAGRPIPPRYRHGGLSRAIADRTDGEEDAR